MLIGVISDTHDRTPNIVLAVDLFNERQVEATLHCGDFVAPFALKPFMGLDSPFYAVFGNNDGERRGIGELFEKNGWTLNDRPATIGLNGFTVAMLHEPDPIDKTIQEGKCDLIVYGHTHRAKVENRDTSLLVNPGEACGWVSGKPTAAIVDLAMKSVEIVDLEEKK